MINTIISSSVLILIILTIRFVVRGKINLMVQYSLWSLVALRLVAFSWLNLNPIESALSVLNVAGNAAETIRGASAVDQVIAGNAEAGTIDNAVLIMDNVRTGVVTSGDGISAAAIDWQLVIMIVWAVGTIALGLWIILVNRRFGKKLFESRRFLISVRADNKRRFDCEGKGITCSDVAGEKIKLLSVYMVDELDSPCLMGYKGEEAIYITSEVAADKEKLRYAIAHELCHYRHHDLIWSIVRGGLLAFYWFNPLVWVAAIMSKRDCELACDYGVIKEVGKEERLAYGKILVDLISQREQKKNVLCLATTMNGSAGGIKERVAMIAKNKKMKATTLAAVLLIVALSVGCTFTTAPNNIKDLSNEEKTEIGAFATKWADAFSQRDAKTIYELCENEEFYLTIGGVAENGEYWMGMSSPWPWNKDYVIDILDSSTIEIYYYFRTSSPTVYTAKETVTIKKIEGKYKATGDSWKHFDKIESKTDFDEAYKFGFPDFTEFAAAYQFQADDDANNNWGRKDILENPVTAAIDQLNLAGAEAEVIDQDTNKKKTKIAFAWNDGEVTVNLIQPMLTDESGAKIRATIWIVVNESDLSDIDRLTDSSSLGKDTTIETLLPEFTDAKVAAAREVVEEYFRAIEAKDDKAILKTLTPIYNQSNVVLYEGETRELLSIDYNVNDSFRESYVKKGGGSNNVTKIENVIVFKVNFNVKYPEGVSGSFDEGDYNNWSMILIRDDNSSPWLIDDQGY